MTLHDKREISKMSLNIFTLDQYNRFEQPANTVIQQLKKELENIFLKIIELKNVKIELAEWEQIMQSADGSQDNLDLQLRSQHTDLMYITGELSAFEEMKIIYAFKHLEITIKQLISDAYPGISTKKFYNWDILFEFLNTKLINSKQLEGYNEVNQLRLVNNCIKHSEIITSEIQNIPEFNQQECLSYTDLGKFYERVKTAPNRFLTSLSSVIYTELYEFDELKLNEIVNSFVLRMDEKTAKKFGQELLSHY